MKILSLRFKNLNSLVGEWFIDFSAPEYVSDGIFAITGPTGSGKSTILDAISLALYGQTPRLEKVNSSTNEIMSRHTGECFAEVVFETGTGRFRCHWAQHRARRHPLGILQAQKHEIADALTGRVIETKLQDTLQAVVERTGMDFDQFTRSMLLAQGGFAVFLQSPPDERAPVLEQITGTAIYSAISVKVHERNRAEQQELETLRVECSGIILLDDDALQAAKAELQAKLDEEAGIINRQSEAEASLRWLRQILVMKGELADMESDFEKLELSDRDFSGDRERMELARRAAGFEPAYMIIRQQQELQDRELREKSGAEHELERLNTDFTEHTERFREAEQKLEIFKGQEKELSMVVREVRALDIRISGKREQCDEMAAEIKALCERISASDSIICGIKREMEQERTEAEDSESYLAEHGTDSRLAASLSGIEALVLQYEEAQAEERDAGVLLAERHKLFENAKTLLLNFQPETVRAGEAFDQSRFRWEELSATLASLLQGTDISNLRMAVQELEERSRNLEILSVRIAAMAEREKRIVTLRETLPAIDSVQSRVAEEIDRLVLLQEKAEQVVEALQREAELYLKIRSLEDERKVLLYGSPCPLCGSRHHPWADGAVPEPSAEGEELQHAKASVLEISEKITALRIEAAGAIKDRAHNEEQIAELRILLSGEDAVCRNLAVQLEIAGDLNAEQVLRLLSEAHCAAEKEAERLGKAILLEKQLLFSESEAQRLHRLFTEAVRAEEKAEYEVKTAGMEVERAMDVQRKIQERKAAIRESLNREYDGYGIVPQAARSCRDVLLILHSRLERWHRANERRTSAYQRIAILEGNLKMQEEMLMTRKGEHAEKEKLLAACTAEFTTLNELRIARFGEKNPDEEEHRLAIMLKCSEVDLDGARRTCEAASTQILQLSTRIAMLASSLTERAMKIREKEALFLQELSESGFDGMGGFVSSRLDREELEQLEQQAKDLAARRLELETLRGERQYKLRMEEDRALTENSPEELQEELDALFGRLDIVRSDTASVKLHLYEHEQAAVMLREKTIALVARQIECSRWSLLHELIGSSDGKKFRNFAQGLTFEIMVHHANRQLMNMTDRYLLVRDVQRPLELNVIDNYQGGEIRSTKNLSGGESFLVSLALALGLSQMSSRNVSVDSLFLDEGFGTLDEDALETALQTLAGLHESGKLIGIISHVPVLRERIGTRIEVKPLNGGRSMVSGPGVSVVNEG
ncbi:AAA family ATPase [Chlorobium phaeobacteroides]|uniref:SMC domain protein n=1 Tax=Chlorobium phaeobacteroides (strain DSM 266 / SMG 266 / 2430) TaxID=290317 RepID=A1BG58_CHLPD|nr:AAA family ATPase [Chlorobium phaeobacteroides]ABL65385.1 SMC domain protein [Chlorobium phaeobacteroides DSM 266]